MNQGSWLALMQRGLMLLSALSFSIGFTAWMFSFVWALQTPHVGEEGLLLLVQQALNAFAHFGAAYGLVVAVCGILLTLAVSRLPFDVRS